MAPLILLFAFVLRADTIGQPTLQSSCSGYEASATCTPGTVVFAIYDPRFGWVPQTRMLLNYAPQTTIADLPVYEPTPGAKPPIVDPPYIAPELPPVAVVPEPGYLGLLAIVALLMALTKVRSGLDRS